MAVWVFYGINGYKLYGPKMTGVEMCGIKVILGRVDIRQIRSGRENSVHRYADRFDVNVNNVKLIYFAK